MGTAMLCLAAIGFLHCLFDEAHWTILRRWVCLYEHPLRHPLHHVPARPKRQHDLRHRRQHGPPRARRRGDGWEDLHPRAAGRQAGLWGEQQGGARVRGGLSDRGPDAVRNVRGPRCVFAQIADRVWNRGEAEVDNSGTVGLLRSLSLSNNHRKVFATAV